VLSQMKTKTCPTCNTVFPYKGKKTFCNKFCYATFSNKRRSAAKRLWAQANKNAVRASQQAWVERNPEKRKQASEAYRKRNAGYYCMKSSVRSRGRKQAEPQWLSTDDKWLMREVYELRDLRNKLKVGGVIWEVDHIAPIQGKVVCGLHVPWNLRVVPREINRRKSAKLTEETYA
jgi:ATPase subunit of ABC transporter with duplicated ATPase domains